ncbi:MAG TPA: hypothetical protein VIE14_04960, partial [Steroidobacteraceae bacterium]
MADAIAALYERDLEALGHAARARVLRQFTWQRSFQTQMATYASLFVRQRLPLPHAQILPLSSSSS